MSGLAVHAALAAGPDWVARTLAILSIFLTIVGFLLTMYLWRKNGPEITVVAYTATGRGAPVPAGFDDVVDVEAHNAGRLSAMIREVGVWIWNEEPSQHGGERRRYLTLEPTVGGFPVEIPSNGGYISAKMPDGSGVSSGMLVQGVAKLGSGQMYKSRVIRIDAPSVPPAVHDGSSQR